MSFREDAKRFINGMLGLGGVKMVNRNWGPRGVFSSLQRLRDRGMKVARVIDIGASDGSWSGECRSVFPQAEYLLVEPLPEHRVQLEALSTADPSTKCWYGALGPASGTVTLYVHGGQTSCYGDSEYAKASVPLEVPQRRLDEVVLETGAGFPDLIKADVQGYELEVLKGADRCLESCGLVMLEVSFQHLYTGAPLAHEVIAFMAARGFMMFDICTYSQRPKDRELAQADMLFARANSLAFSHSGWD